MIREKIMTKGIQKYFFQSHQKHKKFVILILLEHVLTLTSEIGVCLNAVEIKLKGVGMSPNSKLTTTCGLKNASRKNYLSSKRNSKD